MLMELVAPDKTLGKYKDRSTHSTPVDVKERYEEWLQEDIFISGVGEDGKVYFWKGAKRGTEHYINRIHKKIRGRVKGWLQEHRDLNYWKFLTLTVPETDIESIVTFRLAWNRFLTNLRKRFPRMRIFRVYELQERGSVHLHAIIWGIKWIPTGWLSKNWHYGRPNVQRPRSIRGILHYLTNYLEKSFTNVYVQSFMWFWRMRQWACNFPCPVDLETNSNSKIRIWGVGVGVLRGKEADFINISGFTIQLESFLAKNALLCKAYKWTLRNISRPVALEMVAGMLKYNWKAYRHEGLYV